MPMSFDNAPDYTLRGLFRPELDFLDRMPFWVLALIAAAIALAAVLLLARSRSRPPSPCIPGGSMSREKALGHLRRVKAELKGRKGEAAVAAVLDRLGVPALHDMVLADRLGLTQVDHLVRLADGILVLETKAYAGMVTGRVRDREWVQLLRDGEVRTAFPNPVLQNARHVAAVRRTVGAGVPVRSLVVSAGTARFCGELEGVMVLLEGLKACLLDAPTGAEDARRLDAAWGRLTAIWSCPKLREAHRERVRLRRMEPKVTRRRM